MTPVQVRISRPRIHAGGGFGGRARCTASGLRITIFIASSTSAETHESHDRLNNSARNTPIACDQSTPDVPEPAGAMS